MPISSVRERALSVAAAERVRRDAAGQALRERLAGALSVPDGGFSINPRTGQDVTGGYAVALFSECERIIGGRVTADDIRDYIFDHASVLIGKQSARCPVVVGGWRNPDDGRAYLDISVVVDTLDAAMTLARRNNQLAVWDFANQRSIPVK